MKKYKLTIDQINHIDRKSSSINDLRQELPRMFAEDLNTAMDGNLGIPRLVLFFDTHDAFQGYKRSLSDSLSILRDEWLRILLARLDLSKGIVIVVAGRELPPWDRATFDIIPRTYLDLQPIGHLNRIHASSYLDQLGISDADLKEGLLRYAEGSSGGFHPYHLGLCADVVIAAEKRGNQLTPDILPEAIKGSPTNDQMIQCLLHYVDRNIEAAVRILSACRTFNRELFFKLGYLLHFSATQADWYILTQFSFVHQVTPSSTNTGTYRIHDLLRRLLREQGDSLLLEADSVLQNYYRDQYKRDRLNIAEAIFHAYQQNAGLAISEWVREFEIALKEGQYDLCQALLDVRTEFTVVGVQYGRLLYLEGLFLKTFGHYEDAKEQYIKALSLSKAWLAESQSLDAYLLHAELLRDLGRLPAKFVSSKEAIACYEEAIESLERALEIDSKNALIFTTKGILHRSIGDLQLRRSLYTEAINSYQHALQACNQALWHKRDHVVAYIQKASTLRGLGFLYGQLDQHHQAVSTIQEAIFGLEQAERYIPENHEILVSTLTAYRMDILITKGVAYRILGDSQAREGHVDEALSNYQIALGCCEAILKSAPNLVYAHTNQAWARQSLADLHVREKRYSEAMSAYQEALLACDGALRFAPDERYTLAIKGNVLRGLADVQCQQHNYQGAGYNYGQAIKFFDRLLHLAPDYVFGLTSKSFALIGLGELQLSLEQRQEAISNLREAREALVSASGFAPANKIIQVRKEEVQKRLEELGAS